MKSLFVRLLLTGSIVSAIQMSLPGATTKGNNILPFDELFTIDTLTVYNPVRSQCDHDPLVTASNKRIDVQRLYNGNMRWMALSRDMLTRWGGALRYGDTLDVYAGDPAIDGLWVLQDTMHKRFRRHGDLLFHEKKRSRGRWTNVIVAKRKFYTRNM